MNPFRNKNYLRYTYRTIILFLFYLSQGEGGRVTGGGGAAEGRTVHEMSPSRFEGGDNSGSRRAVRLRPDIVRHAGYVEPEPERYFEPAALHPARGATGGRRTTGRPTPSSLVTGGAVVQGRPHNIQN